MAPQGRITVTGLLDREKGDMYTLTVVADDGGPKKDSTVVCSFLLVYLFVSVFVSMHCGYLCACGRRCITLCVVLVLL